MKWTVITGACGGLGRAFAELCAQRNMNLLVTGRDEDSLSSLKQDLIEKYDITVKTMVCDLSSLEETKRLCTVLQQMECTLLINCAGFGDYGAFETMDTQHLLDMNQVNMTSLMMLNRAVLSSMKQTGGGIVNVASTAAFQPGPLMANYYATKAYVLSLSEALAMEMKSVPVNICALCCGPMETGFAQKAHLKHTWMQRLLMVSPLSAAKAGLKGLEKGKQRVIPGLINRGLVGCSRLLPHGLLMHIMNSAQSKRQG